MASNPARTFALVNLAIFIVAVGVFLWFRSQGTFDAVSTAPVEPVARPAPAEQDRLPADAVEPASAAQIAFLNEVLTDTTRTLERGFVVVSRQQDTAYYLGAWVAPSDTTDTSGIGLWYMRGSRDAPRSVKAINAIGAQQTLAGRVDSEQDGVSETDAEAQRLLSYLNAYRSGS